jgi:hypothetical protein
VSPGENEARGDRRRHCSTDDEEISMPEAAAAEADKGGRITLLEASELGDL